MGSRLTGEAVAQANNICALMLSEEINTERERENGCKVNEGRDRIGAGRDLLKEGLRKKAIILL